MDLYPVSWRVGRKVGRTIYAVTEDYPDGVLIGLMDTPELAALAVDAFNATNRSDGAD